MSRFFITHIKPKAFGQQLRDRHLLGAGLAAKQNQSIGAEFEDDLAAGAAGRAGAVAFGGHGDGFDPHAGSFGCDCGKDGVALGADGQAVGGVLHIAAVNIVRRAR